MIYKKKISNKQLAENLKISYAEWKKNSLENKGYFIIFNGFKENNKLKNISGNVLKLYVYLGIHSNNTTGEVWHSNNRISKYFDKSERTIRLWMQELEDLNLIKRFQLEFNKESHIFLQPYYLPDQLVSSEKYIYIYRLKNSNYREKVNLLEFSNCIISSIKDYIESCYVNVNPKYFQISSFSPIEPKYLRSISKRIKEANPIFEQYTKTYSYTRSDKSIGYNHHLFERVKNKKT
ncbi:MAG: helix-turn-helix domain-containing protein [Spirochaetaceae bacterium]|nr:helix-turn-helix domain-containing protein [Spirochaetaceae bacterium]